MSAPVKTLVVGLGNMGQSHALAYARNPGFEIVGLVNRSKPSLAPELVGPPLYDSFEAGLDACQPDLVSINTFTDTHADYAVRAMEAGAHVFVEKPLAATVADARRVVDTAKRTGKKLVIGYILRHHPSWVKFVELARGLGSPAVMRLNLNQQSDGPAWITHKKLMDATSPIVDCGVHYVDVMCQICDAKPVRVHGMGARLTDEVAPEMYNYGHLQVLFADGSVGWYEAAWGPMISETAFFVKDVMGPKGSVSIVMDEGAKSADLDTHTKTARIRLHHGALDPNGNLTKRDEMLDMEGEPGHQDLCDREQSYVLQAITEDLDLTKHMEDAVTSLEVVLAADTSIRERRPVDLKES